MGEQGALRLRHQRRLHPSWLRRAVEPCPAEVHLPVPRLPVRLQRQGHPWPCPPLALAHANVVDDKVVLSPWTETDFRTDTPPWYAAVPREPLSRGPPPSFHFLALLLQLASLNLFCITAGGSKLFGAQLPCAASG